MGNGGGGIIAGSAFVSFWLWNTVVASAHSWQPVCFRADATGEHIGLS
ncbi:hypothetical protein SACS_0117 [Parasaccharibacter apium]|uniref:Uncharacterized protein n=1 Tax=Parasaccharibacter apium TaxID=1510841 RepID=A0A7U7IZQ7_9PROT|nr:hypothetical protein SACS_0117 [Parasaccharibacter apium]